MEPSEGSGRGEGDSSPYQGLDFYTEDDARWFFGRDPERKRIISNLRTNRLTMLYAESGVGKSSLLRAGVVARLRELAADSIEARGSARFVPIIFSEWQDEPPGPLIDEIERQAERFRVPVTTSALARHATALLEGGGAAERSENGGDGVTMPDNDLARAIARTAEAVSGTVLIILDQFEEHFRYRKEQKHSERLADLIAGCVNATGLPVHFLIAVREDSYGELGDFFRGRVANPYRNYIHLEYLSRVAARRAIEGPIETYNEGQPEDARITIGDGLIDAVLGAVWRGNLVLGPGPDRSAPDEDVTDASGNEIEAPFLQLVMEQVWMCERAQGSHELRRYTLEVTLGGAKRIVREHLDNALNRLNEDERHAAGLMFRELVTPSGTKVAHTAIDLVGFTGCPGEVVDSALRKLDQQRIVREVGTAPVSKAPRYEIYHDRLAAAILEWLTQQKTEQLRLDKERAEQEQQRAEEARREQERLARQAEVAREQAEIARGQAEEARGQAEEATEKAIREKLRFKRVAACLACVLVIFALLAFYAWRQTVSANNSEAAATKQATRAAYFGLTARAQSQLSTRPDLALLLFLAAYKVSPQPLAERSLVATLQEIEMSGATGILHGHTDAIESVAFDPRAPVLASASGDGTLRLWHIDPSSRYPVGRPLRAGGPVLSTAFSPDGQGLASGSFNKLVVWNVATRRQVRVEHPGGAVVSVAYSPNGDWLAAGSLNGTVFLWNTHTRQSAMLRAAQSKPVRSVAFDRASGILAAGETGGRVVLWNVATGREIRTLRDHRTDIYAVAFSPTSHTLAAAGAGGHIVLWNVADHDRKEGSLTGQDPFIYGLTFGPRGDVLAAAGTGDVELWGPATRTQIEAPLTGQEGAVYGVAFSRDERTLVSGGADRTLRVWSYPVIRKYGVTQPPAHLHPVLGVAVARNGLIASGGGDGTIYVVGGSNTTPVTIRAPKGFHALAFAEDGRVLASAGSDGVIRLWDPTTGGSLGRLSAPTPRKPIFSLASDPRGTTLVSGDGGGNVRVWNLASASQIGPALSGDLGAVFAVAFNPATREVAGAGNGRTIRVWKAERGGWTPSPAIGQDDALFALAFSPSGRTLASAGADGAIRLWNLTASPAAAPKTLVASSAFVRGLAFSPDAKTLASAGADDAVRLWDVNTGTELGDPLRGDRGWVESVAYGPGGQYLVTGSDDHTVRLWRAVALPPSFPALTREVCSFLGAGLNGPERGQYAPGLPFQQTCSRVTPG